MSDILRNAAAAVVHTLRQAGFESYFVGGCVRDLLLGRQPKDYDVATAATPPQVAALFPDSRAVGAHFGVMLVRQDLVDIEVATFRSDLAYTDGRRPDGVRFETDPREDVARRDFTINGLLLDPESNQVLDFVGGQADLEARLIRAIGDPWKRFEEDHLRMLRAVRFAARFGFQIEERTLQAIRELAPKVALVSAERVQAELTRILTEGGAKYGFELLISTRLVHDLLPEVADMDGVPQPPEYHPEGDVGTHVRLMLGLLDQLPADLRTPTLAWGVLLHDIGKPVTITFEDRIRFNGHDERGAEMAARILQRLRFSSDEIAIIRALVADHMRFKDIRNMRESTLKRFMRMPHFAELLELHRIDVLSSSRHLENYQFVRERLDSFAPEVLAPPKLLTGSDLMALGIPAGPALGRYLREIEDLQLEGRLATRQEALEYAQSHFFAPEE